DYEYPSEQLAKLLTTLADRPTCDTREDDYSLWVLQQTQDTLLTFLYHSGMSVTDGLCAELAHWVFDAAVVSKCVARWLVAPQARLMVLALTLTRLLPHDERLRRTTPDPLQLGAAE